MRKRIKLVVVIACVAALPLALSYGIARRVVARSADTTADQVSLYRGDARRTGAHLEPGIRQMSRVRWQASVGEILHGPPVFAGGTVFLLGNDRRLAAIDSATGIDEGRPVEFLYSDILRAITDAEG
jgi:putative pyrroloquinoline-quinone-binding quinoprotein